METKANRNNGVSPNAVIIIVIVLIGAIGGTIVYYNQVVTAKDAQIHSLNAQIAQLTGQVSDLNQANLVTAVGIGVQHDANISVNGVQMTGNALFISGSITNQGKTIANDVRLHVVAKDVYGSTVIDMTVPLYGNFVVGEDPSLLSTADSSISIDAMQTMNYVNVKILCQGEPASWTVTPVYT